MPLARVLILNPEEDGWGLYRYAAGGEFAGDTWHETEGEALDHARWAYGKSLSDWKLIGHPVKDLNQTAKRILKQTK